MVAVAELHLAVGVQLYGRAVGQSDHLLLSDRDPIGAIDSLIRGVEMPPTQHSGGEHYTGLG